MKRLYLAIPVAYYVFVLIYTFNNIPESVIPAVGTDPFVFDILAGEVIARGVMLKGFSAYFFTPYYVYFYSFLKLFISDHILLFKTIIILQMLLFFLSINIFYKLIKLLSNSGNGALVSALLYAFYPLNIFYSVLPLKDIAAVSLLIIYLYLFLSVLENGKKSNIFLAAIILGFLVTLRGSFLPFILIGSIFLFLKMDIKKGVIFFVVAFLPIAPLTARNVIVAKDFALIYPVSGIHSYLGINEYSQPHYVPVKGIRGDSFGHYFDAKKIAQYESGKRLKDTEVNAFWKKKTREYIYKNPLEFSKKIAMRFLVFLNDAEISSNYSFQYFKSNYLPFKPFNYLKYGFGILLATGGTGFLFGSMKHRKFILIQLLILLTVTLMTYVTGRYRMPVAVFLLIGQSALICSFIEGKFTRIWIIPMVVLLVIGFNPYFAYKSTVANNSIRKHVYTSKLIDIYKIRGGEALEAQYKHDKNRFLESYGLKSAR
ncbi:MAG: hypothetical protein C0603_03650 [Denitrovibrio sp.]|nr:MAG: hypothetical protein C0603_03650 [Denitrovibrio sp.]